MVVGGYDKYLSFLCVLYHHSSNIITGIDVYFLLELDSTF